MGNYICNHTKRILKTPYWLIKGHIYQDLPSWATELEAIKIIKGYTEGIIVESWWANYPWSESINFAHTVEEMRDMKLTVSERRNIYMQTQGCETTGIPRSFTFPPEFFDDCNHLIIFPARYYRKG